MVITITVSATIFPAFTLESNQPVGNLIAPDEGDPKPILVIQVKKTDGSATDADIKLTQGSNVGNYSTSGGELTVSAFGTGLHDIEITKTGYLTLNSTIDAQGETMTLTYTLTEE